MSNTLIFQFQKRPEQGTNWLRTEKSDSGFDPVSVLQELEPTVHFLLGTDSSGLCGLCGSFCEHSSWFLGSFTWFLRRSYYTNFTPSTVLLSPFLPT